MTPNEIVSVVQSVGFPIVMVGAMAWFVYYMYNKFMEQLQEQRDSHTKEIHELQTTIDNNTIALTKLIEKIDRGGGKNA